MSKREIGDEVHKARHKRRHCASPNVRGEGHNGKGAGMIGDRVAEWM